MLSYEEITEIKMNIDDAEVVSFDVFDTLIRRVVNRPEDIYVLTGRYFGIYDFEKKRTGGQIKADEIARSKDFPHADIDGIYEYLKNKDNSIDWDAIKNYEIELEQESVICNPEIFELYRYAIDQKKRVIAVSDMYLHREHIFFMLQKCGYTDITELFVSYEDKATKFRGDLYEYVAQKLDVRPEMILHIGDNRESDYDNARSKGWRAYHYVAPHFDEEKKYMLATEVDYGVPESLIKGDFWYDLGVYAGGPLYMGIYNWIKKELSNDNKKVFFIARDGYNLYEMMKDELGDRAKYLSVSRRSMMYAGITDIDDRTLSLIPPFTFGQSLCEIIDFYELPVVFKDKVKDAGFESINDTIAEIGDIVKFRELYTLCKDEFLDFCKKEREEIVQYLALQGFFEPEVYAFDCGWNGSSQFLLDRIIEASGRDTRVHFFYIGIFDTEKSRAQLSGKNYDTFLFDHSTNYSVQESVKQAVAVFELFFGAPSGMTIKYKGGTPVIGDAGIDSEIKNKLCKGICDFVNRAKNFVDISKLDYTPEVSLAPILRLIENPTIEEAKTIGGLENPDDFAKKSDIKKYFAFANEEDYDKNHNLEIYWLQGFMKRPDIDASFKRRVAIDRGYELPEQDENTNIDRDEQYYDWIKKHEKIDRFARLSYKPKFSIVIPVYNVEEELLTECIESITEQSYKNWELILVDDASTWKSVKAVLSKYENKKNIKVIYRKENGNISIATNDGIDVASGDYIVFADCDDVIAKNALLEFARLLNKNPDYDFIYSDEDKLTEDGSLRHSPFFKPDWSPDTFMSIMYTNHLATYRTDLVKKTGGLRTEFNGAQDYDFTLRFMELSSNDRVGHVPKVLYHWRERKGSIATGMAAKPQALEAMKRLKEEALTRRGLAGEVRYISDVNQYRVIYKDVTNPLVSIIIPSKDNFDMLRICIESIREHTSYTNYEMIVVDNGSEEGVKKQIDSFLSSEGISYIYDKMDFNFSKMCNIGVEKSNGEYIVLLNDDIEIFQKDWLDIMLGQASLDYVGAVGAKLLYPNSNKIQHIGVTNLYIGPSHNEMGCSDDKIYYFGRNRVNYNYLAVTGACLLVKKSKYEEVGMLDENLAVAYNDVDLCFSLYEKGYYNVVRSDVAMYHHESVSRGDDITIEKRRRLLNEARILYTKHPGLEYNDPFYNVNLTKYKSDYSLDVEEKTVYSAYPDNVYKKYNYALEGNVDEINETTGVFFIRGWFISSDKYERLFTRYMVLENQDDGRIVKIKLNRRERKDIADVYGESKRMCGFDISFSREILGKGYDNYTINFYTKDRFGLIKRYLNMGKRLGV